MPEPMTPERRREFLTERGRTAVVATLRADGRPHAVPVWYALDGEDVLVNAGEETVKVRDVLRDPRTTVVVEDAAPPYAFVMLEGTSEVLREPERVRADAERIAAHYLDGEAAEQFVQYATSPGKVTVRVRPTHVVAMDRVGG